ncbi:MAG TPA: Mov34/MPN/PAD-1 family protein [Burkholderiaceae bacterium]|nr:Mov34/MPN/PAD-1 family protein [Burkholderiaceae bacterium]
MNSRTFFMPDHSGYVIFETDVLSHMYGYAQRRFYLSEAGGQLFSSTPHDSAIIISAVSGPNSRDQRRRHSFVPNAEQATTDRREQFGLGRYPIGLWHTHPESNPTPSSLDESTTKEWLGDFLGTMHGFLLAIVGNRGAPPALSVWLARTTNPEDWICLEEG